MSFWQKINDRKYIQVLKIRRLGIAKIKNRLTFSIILQMQLNVKAGHEIRNQVTFTPPLVSTVDSLEVKGRFFLVSP